MQDLHLQPLQESDYPKLINLWESSDWIDVRQTDTREALAKFLHQNPSCNFASYVGTKLVGSVLAGHDSWRGYLYHMAVAPDYQKHGIGTQLVSAAVEALKQECVPKVHCLVKRDNLIVTAILGGLQV